MTLDEALKKIFSMHQFHIKLGLDNIKQLLAHIGNPEKELKAFQKVNVPANGSVPVNLELKKEAFSFYDTISGDWTLEPGKFEILVGSSSQHIWLKDEISF